MKKKLFGKIISLGLVMTVAALVFSTSASAIENENLEKTDSHNDTSNLHPDKCETGKNDAEKTYDINIVNTNGSQNNNCNNINIDIKNIVNTNSDVHHSEGEHPEHMHSDTHYTNHGHTGHLHSFITHIFQKIVAGFPELVQHLDHVSTLINHVFGVSI